MNLTIQMSGLYPQEGFQDGFSLDLRGIAGTCCYCDPDAETAIREALRDFPLKSVHWIDTGDYHYLTYFFLSRIEEPFCLVLIDNHPDDQPGAFGADTLSCGSWVRNARSLENWRDLSAGLPVYLSIDLDALGEEYFRTDWDQGNMTPSELEESIRRIAADHRIIGIDICGGITEEKGATSADIALNSVFRKRFRDFLSGII